MSDQPDNIVLIYLRRIDEKLDRVIGDVQDLKRRVTSLEENTARLHQDYAGLQLRMDRMESRLDHIERALDLHGVRP